MKPVLTLLLCLMCCCAMAGCKNADKTDAPIVGTPETPCPVTPEKTEEELRAEALASAEAHAAAVAARKQAEQEAMARARFTITATYGSGKEYALITLKGDIADAPMSFGFYVERFGNDRYGNLYDLSEWRSPEKVTVQGGSAENAVYVMKIWADTTLVRVVASDGAMATATLR